MGASLFGSFAVVRLLCDAPGIALTASSVIGETSLMHALATAPETPHADIAAFLRSRSEVAATGAATA